MYLGVCFIRWMAQEPLVECYICSETHGVIRSRCDCGAYVHEACLRKYNAFSKQTQCTICKSDIKPPPCCCCVFFRSIKGLCFRPKTWFVLVCFFFSWAFVTPPAPSATTSSGRARWKKNVWMRTIYTQNYLKRHIKLRHGPSFWP